jgi:hypothetical protein
MAKAPWEQYPGAPEVRPQEAYGSYADQEIQWSDKIIDPEEMWRYTWANVNLRTGKKEKGSYWWVWNKRSPGLTRPKDYSQMHPNMIKNFTDTRCLPLVKEVMKHKGQFGPSCQGHFPTKEIALKNWRNWMKMRVKLRRGFPMKLQNPWTRHSYGLHDIGLGDIVGIQSRGKRQIIRQFRTRQRYSYDPNRDWPKQEKRIGILAPAYNRFHEFYHDLKKYEGKGAFVASFQTLITDFKQVNKRIRVGPGQKGMSEVRIKISLEKRMQETMPPSFFAMVGDKKNFINRFRFQVIVKSRNDEENKECWNIAHEYLKEFLATYEEPKVVEKSMWDAYGEQGRKIARRWQQDPWYEQETYGRKKYRPDKHRRYDPEWQYEFER